MIAEVNVIVAVAVIVADDHAAAVIVEIDLEVFALLVGEKAHEKQEARLPRTLAEAGGAVVRSSVGIAAPVSDEGVKNGPQDQKDHRDPQYLS